MVEIQMKILHALVEAGGEISVGTLRGLYSNPTRSSEGNYHAALIRRRWTEWVRPDNDPTRAAIAVRITEAGRAAILAPTE